MLLQTIAIQKAVQGSEHPIKSKHIRLAIIGTYQSKGGHAFWAVAIRQPLQENRIVAWKFCHLLHKVLREGHPLTNQHSMRHRKMLTDAGKLWVSGLSIASSLYLFLHSSQNSLALLYSSQMNHNK